MRREKEQSHPLEEQAALPMRVPKPARDPFPKGEVILAAPSSNAPFLLLKETQGIQKVTMHPSSGSLSSYLRGHAFLVVVTAR